MYPAAPPKVREDKFPDTIPYSLLLELVVTDPEVIAELWAKQEGRDRDEYALGRSGWGYWPCARRAVRSMPAPILCPAKMRGSLATCSRHCPKRGVTRLKIPPRKARKVVSASCPLRRIWGIGSGGLRGRHCVILLLAAQAAKAEPVHSLTVRKFV